MNRTITMTRTRRISSLSSSSTLLHVQATLILFLLGHQPVIAHQAIDDQLVDLTKRIVAHPTDASLFMRRGELHRIHGDHSKAMADCDRSLRIEPGFAEAELCLARTLLDAGEADPSLEHLDRFLRARPASVEGWMTRGRAQARLGRYLEAARDFTRALQECDDGSPPPEPGYYLERAGALVDAGTQQVNEAIRALDEGMRVFGPIVSLQLKAIDLELVLGRYDAALSRLETLAARSQRQEGWLAQRATILERAGRIAEARTACTEALAAIGALPPARRSVPAIRDLGEQLRATLDRLALAPSGPPGVGR